MLIFLILLNVICLVAGFLFVIRGKKPANQTKAKEKKLYRNIYAFISKNFITQKSVSKIYNSLANLSIYRKEELHELTSMYFLISWGASLGLAISSIFLFKDFLSTIICIVFSIFLNNILIDKQIDKSYRKVLQSLRVLISSVRQEYLRLGNVVESLNECDCPDILKKLVDEMYQILTSVDGELRLQEFYESTPFRPVQTLAGICYDINNQGDNKDAYGQSNFVQALTLLASDVNSEIEKLVEQKDMFGIIEYLALTPIFVMGVIEGFFINTMPGTALIYNGPIGYFARTITVVLSAVAYTIVSRINCTIPIKEDDRISFIVYLLEFKFIKKFVNNIKAKNAKAYKLSKKLKDALSKVTVEQFYLEKVIISSVVFVISVLLCITAVSLGKDYIENSTQQLSLVASGEMEKFTHEQILALDNFYMSLDYEPSQEEAKSIINQYMPGLSDMQILDQQKRIKDKKESLKNAYFKWWYIWICFLVGVGGWFIPEALLKFRTNMVKNEAEEDFLQLQTLVSILMNVEIDTLDTLYKLCQNSRIHKDILLYCYHNFPSNPDMELTRLISKTPILEFKRFIGTLKLTISDLSLKEAFSDLIIEREHILKLRQKAIHKALENKRAVCGKLVMLPIGAMVLGELLVPLFILGINELMNALSMMG